MDADQWALSPPEVVETVASHIDSDETATLVTVLDVEGSAYRRPGAKMVITAGGSQIGSVTAGCLEAEFVEIARGVRESETPRVETFDLTDDDGWGLGVGCNGVITFLFEPLTGAYAPVEAAISADKPMALLATIDGQNRLSTRGVYSAETGIVEIVGEFSAGARKRIRARLTDAIEDGSTVFEAIEDGTLCLDGIVAPPRLLLLGHGNDVGPVVELGRKNGFQVEVAAFRGASNATERFAAAQSVHTLSPTEVGEKLSLDANTYVVIMSHNLVDDTLAFQEVLDSPVPYIGLLGPRERFEELRANVDGEIQLNERDRERIYTPVGIDLGGGTPYQIAHSIVAEVLAVHNDREVDHLTDRAGPIHER